jgi:hypothetical protein
MADTNDSYMTEANDLEKRMEAKKRAWLYEMVCFGSLMYPAFEYAQNGKITVFDIIFTAVVLVAGIGLVSRITRRADKPEMNYKTDHNTLTIKK